MKILSIVYDVDFDEDAADAIANDSVEGYAQ